MDSTMDSDNLLLLALPSSYASVATDGISISGNVADPSMVHTKAMEIGEVGTVTNPPPTPSSVAAADIVERETGVPPLVLEEVIDGSVTGEKITSESIMPTSDLGPPRNRKTTGTASATYAPITSTNLCRVCLIKKKLPLLVPLTNRVTSLILSDSCRRRAIKCCVSGSQRSRFHGDVQSRKGERQIC